MPLTRYVQRVFFEALKLLSDLLLARKFMRRSETLGKKSGFDVGWGKIYLKKNVAMFHLLCRINNRYMEHFGTHRVRILGGVLCVMYAR